MCGDSGLQSRVWEEQFLNELKVILCILYQAPLETFIPPHQKNAAATENHLKTLHSAATYIKNSDFIEAHIQHFATTKSLGLQLQLTLEQQGLELHRSACFSINTQEIFLKICNNLKKSFSFL